MSRPFFKPSRLRGHRSFPYDPGIREEPIALATGAGVCAASRRSVTSDWPHVASAGPVSRIEKLSAEPDPISEF